MNLEEIRAEKIHDPKTFSTTIYLGVRMGDTRVSVSLQQGDSPKKVAEALLDLAAKVEQC